MSTNLNTLYVYWQHARKYKKQLWIIYPSMVVAQFAEDVLGPIFISIIITNIAQGNTEALAFNLIWKTVLIIILLEVLAHLIWNRIVVPVFWRTQDAIMRDISMTVFNHLTKMSYRFFSDRFAGSLVNQTNKFVGSFERLTDPLTWNVFKLIVGMIFTSIILTPKTPQVVVGIWLITIIYVPVIWFYRRRQLPYNRRWASAESKRTGQLADTISNIMAVKSFANESHERKLMQQRVDLVHKRSNETMHIAMRQELASGFLQRSINILTIIVSIALAISGKIEVGVIYLALNYTIAIMRRLWDLNNSFRAFTRVFGDASDMSDILQIKPEIEDGKVLVSFKATKGRVDMDQITFWYPEQSEKDSLFRDFSLKINPSEKIGLVGPSGGGKTSITKLLLRFMDIQKGSIKIDGHDIAEMKQSDLRNAITYVPQEPLLFHRSIRDNILYGSTGVSDDELIKTAKKAHAHEFISNLPDGYETLVGERGVKLSGGQKQRIAIARAFLKDAPIIVLDEATSALDSESEKLIQDSLWKLMQGKTAIVIAHRLSTIQKMDRIVVLDGGKIIETGAHTELIKKKNGLYARLWSHQSGGFLQD
jgi:ATP-binding cassette subfamily B protein